MSDDAHFCTVTALIEALPFIQSLRGQTVVIKYGGSAMEDEHLVERTLRDVVFLEAVGVNPVIVHGGGKAITSRMKEAGLKAQFVNGLRVTDAASIAIVESTLDNVINPMIVGKIVGFGGKAVSISGRSVIRARKSSPQAAPDGTLADLGFVGDVAGVDLAAVETALSQGVMPVISPIGIDETGAALNVNADVAAAAVAGALRAAKLIFISDVLGLMRDPAQAESLIPSVNRTLIDRLTKEGVIAGGMLPKVESSLAALAQGVGKVHFIDGRVAHSLLLALLTSAGTGTEITL